MLPTKRCSACRAEKSTDAFDFKDRAAGRLQSKCRECAKVYKAAHYQANRELYVKRAADRNKAERKTKRQIVAEYKARPCADCGQSFPWYVMEFDHRDPEAKVGNIGNMKNDTDGMPKFLAELAKCDVVCSNCHKARTYLRGVRLDRQPVAI